MSRFSIIVARRIYRKNWLRNIKKKNLDNYNNAGKVYVTNFGKIYETILSFYDLIKINFINHKEHLKNEHLIIKEEINLDEK